MPCAPASRADAERDAGRRGSPGAEGTERPRGCPAHPPRGRTQKGTQGPRDARAKGRGAQRRRTRSAEGTERPSGCPAHPPRGRTQKGAQGRGDARQGRKTLPDDDCGGLTQAATYQKSQRKVNRAGCKFVQSRPCARCVFRKVPGHRNSQPTAHDSARQRTTARRQRADSAQRRQSHIWIKIKEK